MTRDPNQLFVMNAVTRKQIRDEVEEVRGCCGYKHPIDPQEVAENDYRLTDEICQAYADALGNIDISQSEDSAEEESHNAVCIVLEAMGYVCEDDVDDEDDERKALLEEILQTENALAQRRARLQQLDRLSGPDNLQTPGSVF